MGQDGKVGPRGSVWSMDDYYYTPTENLTRAARLFPPAKCKLYFINFVLNILHRDFVLQ